MFVINRDPHRILQLEKDTVLQHPLQLTEKTLHLKQIQKGMYPNYCTKLSNNLCRSYSPLSSNSHSLSPEVHENLDIPKIDLINEMQEFLPFPLDDTPPIDRSVS